MNEPNTPGQPAALGDLERVPLPSLLYTLYKKRLTGYVSLREGGQASIVYFRDGTPVASFLPLQTEHLGRVLLETGVIDQATYEESLRRLTETGQRQGDILKAMGKLTDEQLTVALKLQLRRKLNALFGITRASFEVYAVDHEFGRAEELSQMRVHPRRLIYAGIRHRYTAERLDREAGRLDGYAARVAGAAAASLDKYAFEPEDQAVVTQLAQRHLTVDELCAAAKCERTVARMVLYALWVTEALDLVAPDARPGAAAADASPAADSAPPAAPAPAATAPAPAAAAGPLRPLRPTLKPPLAPLPTPTPAQTTAAAAAAARATTPTPVSTTAASRAATIAAGPGPVSGATGATAPVPTPPPSRPTLARAAAATVASANLAQRIRGEVESRYRLLEKQNLFEVLGLTEAATRDEVRAAYLDLAKTFHPDRLPGLGLGELRPQVERIFARISEAHATLADDEARKKYQQTMRDGGKGDMSRAQRILEGEIAYQKGLVLLKRKDWAPALAELRRCVSLNPDEAEHHAVLAWTQWQASPDKAKAAAEAKPMLQKALGLQSRCHRAHFYLAEILMSEGALPQALNSYQRVLALDPDNVDAQRAVRLINLRLEKEAKKGGGLFDRFRKK